LHKHYIEIDQQNTHTNTP